MKGTELVICSFALLLALAGQSPTSKTVIPAAQVDQQPSGRSDQQPVGADGNEIPPSTDRLPMANISDLARVCAADLTLTPNQQAKRKVILQLQQQQVQAVIYDPSLSQERRIDKFRSLNDALLAEIRDLLTEDQRKKFDLKTGRKTGDSEVKNIKGDSKSALQKADPANISVPKLTLDLRAASYKFQVKFDNGGQQQVMNLSTTIREDNGAWTATDVVDAPNGQTTDVSTLEKGSLILKKRSLRQGPVSVNLDFSGNKAEGSLSINGVRQPIDADLGGPLFVDSAGWEEVIACLPLAVGYSTSFRNFDLQKHRSKLMLLKVTGVENVTVPAGTFKAFRVELTPIEGGPEKSTVWIANDSRTPVKVFAVLGSVGRATMNAELVRQDSIKR